MSGIRKPDNWPARWSGKTWSGDTGRPDAWTLTEAELLAAWQALDLYAHEAKALRHSAVGRSLGVERLQERKPDRALQLLRRAGLAVWTSADGWRAA